MATIKHMTLELFMVSSQAYEHAFDLAKVIGQLTVAACEVEIATLRAALPAGVEIDLAFLEAINQRLERLYPPDHNEIEIVLEDALIGYLEEEGAVAGMPDSPNRSLFQAIRDGEIPDDLSKGLFQAIRKSTMLSGLSDGFRAVGKIVREECVKVVSQAPKTVASSPLLTLVQLVEVKVFEMMLMTYEEAEKEVSEVVQASEQPPTEAATTS